ncbi:MAG: carbohydrate ABC transporter substrate-binding protein [Lachnospiraceae bacterium]|nr:carbohydrate ABC transporter substrate-binding protein [Lachnospiraceae bacterium]
MDSNLADVIRALNTELLAGNGADILILDGLPIESYQKKGVLKELSDFVKEAEKEQNLLSNIVEGYEEDGKIYGIPLRFEVPIYYGDKDAVNALSDMESIERYCNSVSDGILFGKINTSELFRTLFLLNYDTLFLENGKADPDAVLKFLNEFKVLKKRIGSTEGSKDIYNTGTAVSQVINLECGFELKDFEQTKESVRANIAQIHDFMELSIPLYQMEKQDGIYTDIQSQYVPSAVAGINSASKNIELAESFIKTVLSTELQSMDLEDGFPVNEDALTSWIEKCSDQDMQYSMAIYVDGEDIELECVDSSEANDLAECIRTLDQPVSYDQVLLNLIMKEMKPFFNEQISEEEAVQKIVNIVDAYLEE